MAQRARRIEEETPEPANDVIDLMRRVESDPACILTDEKLFEAYYAHVEKEALSTPVDISTEAGRDKIKSAAYAVARKKTSIDNAGKALTEEWRRKTSIVNAARNVVKERFEGLRNRVRQPVTEWEESEAARKAEADRIIDMFRNAAIVRADESADDVNARLNEIRGLNINDEILGPRTDMATDLRDEAVKALTEALERLRKAEEERAELARLRQAEQDRIEREQKEAAEREAREAEERRKADDERQRQEAADRARREAEEVAERARREELDRIEREKQEAIEAANERARKAEEEAQAERDRIAKEEADRKAEAERLAEEQRRREADQAHRSAVMSAAKQAIMSCGADEETARKIVLAIKAGEVPAVTISF